MIFIGYLVFEKCQFSDGIPYMSSVYEFIFIKDYIPYPGLTQNPLSKRELEVLQLLGMGLSTAEIAEKLFISPETVTSHRKNIMRKTKTRNTVELIVESLKNGIL